MKVITKAMSSPSRVEKFPPPLMMRFLRTNVGSQSRGRSRASPMFIRKKNTPIETTQEPSSPKVTCIGQVRVRRPSGGRKRSPASGPCSCSWVRKALFCHHFAKKLKPSSIFPKPRLIFPNWRQCHWFSPFGYCKRSRTRDDSPKMESNREDKDEDEEEEEEAAAEAGVEPKEGFKWNSCSPPKNAFILTRCRSAPFRSSSLAGRFWGSPLATSETEDEENRGGQRPTSEREPGCRDSVSESSMDQEKEGNLGDLREIEGSIVNGGNGKPETGEGEGWILTRCKSEPARRGERLANQGRERRLGFAEPRPPHVCD